jgi:hypothetical protein
VIIAPDGGDACAPAKPRPDEALIRALARAHRWKRMLEDGTRRSAAEIAEAEHVDRSYVNRLMRLTLLAPDIQEAILDGRQPKGMQLKEMQLKEMTRSPAPAGCRRLRSRFAIPTTHYIEDQVTNANAGKSLAGKPASAIISSQSC